MVRRKKVAHDQESIWLLNIFWSVFLQKKWHNLSFTNKKYKVIFSTKVSENQSDREALTVFSRLPS